MERVWNLISFYPVQEKLNFEEVSPELQVVLSIALPRDTKVADIMKMFQTSKINLWPEEPEWSN